MQLVVQPENFISSVLLTFHIVPLGNSVPSISHEVIGSNEKSIVLRQAGDRADRWAVP